MAGFQRTATHIKTNTVCHKKPNKPQTPKRNKSIGTHPKYFRRSGTYNSGEFEGKGWLIPLIPTPKKKKEKRLYFKSHFRELTKNAELCSD